MNILIATNSYPTKKNPTRQVFVKNIYKGLKNELGSVDLVHNKYFNYFKSDLGEGTAFTSICKVLFLFVSYAKFVFFKAKEYDIIYTHAPVLPGFLMLIPQRLFGIKHVCYVHGTVNEYVKKKGILFKLAKFTLSRCDLILTNSLSMQANLLQEYGCHSIVISPGYNSNVYSYSSANKKTDILFAGNAVEGKGIDIFLDAVYYNRKFYKHNNISVSIHCSGEKKKQYINFVENNRLTDIITFGDKLEEEDLKTQFRSTKIVVLPSREEALGLVGIEAIACGAFLIASDTGGMKEYVIHGKNGYLFENENYQQLHLFIKKALENYSSFQAKQPQISKSVEAYSLDNSIKEMISIFEKLLQ